MLVAVSALSVLVVGLSGQSDRQVEAGRFPARPFLRQNLDKLTWTATGGTPDKTVGLKPGDYMRHPAAGVHWDGALDEEVLVAISGYGPTSAKVVDGGELFARSRPGK